MDAVVREFLVVEDDAPARAVACEMLQALGYVTHCTDTGAAAIAHCASNSPDVVLMDVRMPDRDGLEATRQLRRLQGDGLVRPCRVILTVPFTALEGRSACVDAGADGFVTKPLLLTRLSTEIVACWDWMSVARSKRTQTHGPVRDFDLILMDIQMPGRDGLELTRQLTAGPTTRHTVVVAFTAYAMKGDEAKMRAAGCDGHLSKPIDVATFAARVRAYRAQLNRSPFRGVASLPRRDGNRAIATCPIAAPSAGISPLPSAWRSDNPAPCRSRVV